MSPAGVHRRVGETDVLADLATLGPAFVVATGPAPEGPGGWRPWADLDGDELAARVAGARARLGVEEDRVAASVVFQGLAARVVAPLLGAAGLHDRLLLLTPPLLHWRSWDGGVAPLWIAAPRSAAVTPDGLVAAVTALLAGPASALHGRVRVAERLLWGDAAAAVGGVLRVVSRERPHALAPVVTLAEGLLARAPLAATGSVVRGTREATVARRTCCLVYRVPGARTCSDCVFGAGTEGPGRRGEGSGSRRLTPPGRPGGGSSR